MSHHTPGVNDVDAVLWRVPEGRRWHRMGTTDNGSEPFYSICGISKFRFCEGVRENAPIFGEMCRRCEKGK